MRQAPPPSPLQSLPTTTRPLFPSNYELSACEPPSPGRHAQDEWKMNEWINFRQRSRRWMRMNASRGVMNASSTSPFHFHFRSNLNSSNLSFVNMDEVWMDETKWSEVKKFGAVKSCPLRIRLWLWVLECVCARALARCQISEGKKLWSFLASVIKHPLHR